MSLLSRILSFFGSAPAQAPYKIADTYLDMRAMVLQLTPADVGVTDDTKILAVVMDTGLRDAAYTLIATLDGSASVYFSNGGGIIGAGGQPDGAKAAAALIAEASQFTGEMSLTKDTPVVMPGMTAFYLVSGEGIRTVSAKENDFGEMRHAVSPLFHKAHELLFTIKVINEVHSEMQ